MENIKVRTEIKLEKVVERDDFPISSESPIHIIPYEVNNHVRMPWLIPNINEVKVKDEPIDDDELNDHQASSSNTMLLSTHNNIEMQSASDGKKSSLPAIPSYRADTSFCSKPSAAPLRIEKLQASEISSTSHAHFSKMVVQQEEANMVTVNRPLSFYSNNRDPRIKNYHQSVANQIPYIKENKKDASVQTTNTGILEFDYHDRKMTKDEQEIFVKFLKVIYGI